jgi:membrane protease YdiL (CAAX protease family)
MMEAAADDSRVVPPYGFLGLCISLIAILVLAVLGTALVVGLTAGIAAVVMGPDVFLARAQRAFGPDGAVGTRVLFAIVLLFYVAVAVAIFVAAKWRAGDKWRDLVALRPFGFRDRIIWIIMGGALGYSALASGAMGHFLPHPAAQLSIPADPASSAALLALAAIFAPVTEELLFRGWIYTALRYRAGFWTALLISSALFAAAHYDETHIYALAVFPIGLALGVIRERTGSIKASILFHAVNNFAAFCLSALSNG